jgi:hypothetical protein
MVVDESVAMDRGQFGALRNGLAQAQLQVTEGVFGTALVARRDGDRLSRASRGELRRR